MDGDRLREKSPVTGATRREILRGGGILIGSGILSGCASGTYSAPHAKKDKAAGAEASGEQDDPATKESAFKKDLFLVKKDEKDPAVYSASENRFWNEILSEHAKFFAMLLPGKELAPHRDQAHKFQKSFQDRFEQAKAANLTKDDYAAFNRQTVDLVKPFIDWQHQKRDEQASGKIRGLVWPSFFGAAAQEAERFVRRLQQFNGGSSELDRGEVVEFWAHDNAGHAGMIGHLLDPEETELVKKALESQQSWMSAKGDKSAAKGGDQDPLLKTAQDWVDFETTMEKDVFGGKVRSILHPLMADHMRREGLRFVDELKKVT